MFKSISKIFSSHVAVKIIGLANIAITLSFLTVDNFGEYSYYLVLLQLVSITCDPFFSSYLQDFRTYNYQKYNLGILIFPIILLPFFYLVILKFKSDFKLIIFILFCCFYILSAVLKSFLNAKERYSEYGLVDVFRQTSIFISTIAVFYFLKNNDFIFLLTINYVVALSVIFILFIILIKKDEIALIPEYLILKKIIKDSKYLILYAILIPFISFIDSYFVETYLTSKDLGLYSFSLKIFNISVLLIIPIQTVLNIKQIEIAKENGYKIFFKTYFKKIVIFSSVVFVGAILFNWIVTNFIYTEYQSTYWVSNILLCTSFFSYLSLPFSFLLAYRKYQLLFGLAVLGIFINIFINYFFISQYGIYAAAISTFLALTIINLGGAILSYFTLKENEVI
ncbi:MAG: hypothetical protein GW809_09335 [Bacteroidetes bacterium]|nr:hypothetical protein [Bacteroidota bacterium]